MDKSKSKVKNTPSIKKFKMDSQTISVLLAIFILSVIFGLANKNFFRWGNIITIFTNAAILGIMATGMTMTMLTGGIDLSVTANAAFSGMVVGFLFNLGVSPFIGMFVALACGAVFGLINGFLIAKIKILPLIATIGMQLIYRALAYAITDMKAVYVHNDAFLKFGRGNFLSIPYVVFYMIILYFIMGYVLKHTSFGRKIYAIGGNSKASFLCGIQIEKVQLLMFMISGIIASFAGILVVAQAGAAMPQTLYAREFDIISAVILGGVTFGGGKGKMSGTFLGIILFAILSNGMVMINLQSYWQEFARGVVLILAISIDVIRNRKQLLGMN